MLESLLVDDLELHLCGFQSPIGPFFFKVVVFLDDGLHVEIDRLSLEATGGPTAAGIQASWGAGHCLDEPFDGRLGGLVPIVEG